MEVNILGHTSKYKVDKPYPTVEIECFNPYYASLLLDDYASIDSEYTAISQYVFGHILAGNTEVADTFLGIGIIEMTHLDMLADVILDLGVYPKFVGGNGKVWNSNFVPYGVSTQNRIQLAIKAEYGAIEQYRDHICKIKDKEIDALLERIILDEELHIKIFKQLLEKFN
ncbi:MAG: rubrerythrin [Clostridiaceae bacterium]|nr:rubrerythrin [Clostridiaceae bacterium]